MKSIARPAYFLILALSILLNSGSLAAEPSLQGDITFRWEGDVAIYTYEAKISDMHLDSLWLGLGLESYYLLYAEDSNGIWFDQGCVRDISEEGYCFRGTLRIVPPTPEWLPFDLRFEIKGSANGEEVHIVNWKNSKPQSSLIFNFCGFGYAEGELTSLDARHAAIIGLEFGLRIPLKSGTFYVSSKIRDNASETYAVSVNEPLDVRYEFLPFGRNSLVPSPYIGYKNSRLTLRRREVEFTNHEWKPYAGISLEGTFERISYTYTPALDTYHTFSVMLARASGSNIRVGTEFEYIYHERLNMFRVQFYLEGLVLSDYMETLSRVNRRPFWHKTLSMVSVLPAYGIVRFLLLL